MYKEKDRRRDGKGGDSRASGAEASEKEKTAIKVMFRHISTFVIVLSMSGEISRLGEEEEESEEAE